MEIHKRKIDSLIKYSPRKQNDQCGKGKIHKAILTISQRTLVVDVRRQESRGNSRIDGVQATTAQYLIKIFNTLLRLYCDLKKIIFI